MAADVSAALARLAALDGVPAAAAEAAAAAAAVRWHPGLRRRWREARAETAVRSAVASGAVEGAHVPVDWLRAVVAAGPPAGSGDRPGEAGDDGPRGAGEGPAGDGDGPAEATVRAAWRAQVHVGDLLGDLGAPGPAPVAPAAQVLAGLHRDLTAHLVPGHLSAAVVGRPRPDAVDRLGTVLEAMDATAAPALVRVGVVHAEIVTAAPFGVADGLLARAVARLLAVRSGLEPTGVAVLDAHPAADPAGYRRALAGYASGTPAGVASWLTYQAQAVVVGAAAGAAVADAVLAGRLGAGDEAAAPREPAG